ncbi:MAG: hypothetical protein FWH04_00390 [Oscillospiraceae bacterium]|nr:hypothetical protein [Oscillospiraceae bacterium]
MKNSIKVLAGVVVMFVVLGTLTLLAIKYFDVLVRVFDSLRDGFARKKVGLFSEECCDCCDDDLQRECL